MKLKNTKDANGLHGERFEEETVKAIAMVPFINEDVDEDLIGTRPIKQNGSEILDEDYTWAVLLLVLF